MAIRYADMTAEQKKRAEKWADKWGVPVEVCPMNNRGWIITSPKQMLKYMSALDYDIITKDHVKRSQITDEYRKKYLEQLERDLPSKEEMEHVKATFASLR